MLPLQGEWLRLLDLMGKAISSYHFDLIVETVAEEQQ
jgi:hypothetical protein